MRSPKAKRLESEMKKKEKGGNPNPKAERNNTEPKGIIPFFFF